MSTPQAIRANNIETESPEDRERLEELYVLGKKIPPVPEDLPEPSFSDNAWYIGRTRYAFRDKDGKPIESPKQMLWRISYNIATAERLYSENPERDHMEMARAYYGMMARQEYVANTPTMLNAGKPNQQLSACFVLPVEDDLNAILDSASGLYADVQRHHLEHPPGRCAARGKHGYLALHAPRHPAVCHL
jgi:ribonucleotide reductase alpha subunit